MFVTFQTGTVLWGHSFDIFGGCPWKDITTFVSRFRLILYCISGLTAWRASIVGTTHTRVLQIPVIRCNGAENTVTCKYRTDNRAGTAVPGHDYTEARVGMSTGPFIGKKYGNPEEIQINRFQTELLHANMKHPIWKCYFQFYYCISHFWKDSFHLKSITFHFSGFPYVSL